MSQREKQCTAGAPFVQTGVCSEKHDPLESIGSRGIRQELADRTVTPPVMEFLHHAARRGCEKSGRVFRLALERSPVRWCLPRFREHMNG